MCAPQDVGKTLSEYGVKGSSRILVLQQATAAQKSDLDAASDRQERIKRLRSAVDKMAGRSASRSQRSLVRLLRASAPLPPAPLPLLTCLLDLASSKISGYNQTIRGICMQRVFVL